MGRLQPGLMVRLLRLSFARPVSLDLSSNACCLKLHAFLTLTLTVALSMLLSAGPMAFWTGR